MTVAVPLAALEPADIITCCGASIDSEKLLGEALKPDGSVAVTCTLPVNPFTPVTETWTDSDAPGAISTVVGCVDIEKSGWGPVSEGEAPPPQETNEKKIAAITKPIARLAAVANLQHLGCQELAVGAMRLCIFLFRKS